MLKLEVFKGRWNIFEHFRQRPEVFGKSSEIFGSGWDVFGNPSYDKTNISHIIRKNWQV